MGELPATSRCVRPWTALWFGLAAMLAMTRPAPAAPRVEWSQLPPLPDAEGFAGAFAGVSHGALLVAGGANIPGDKWAEPLVKKWYDSVFVLPGGAKKWTEGFRLPRALAYGVSASLAEGVICAGGSDAKGHTDEVIRLEWVDGEVRRSVWPHLPRPCANACGAVLGRTLYLAGGLESPAATTALHTFWALSLDESPLVWRELEPWPGPERMLAVAGVRDGSFFLFSGARLHAGAEGQPVREYLRDAYRFTPGRGWQRLAELPRAAVAAPSPAVPVGHSELLIVSGDDGTKVSFQPVREHPGFPREVLAYDAQTDAWRSAGEAPISRATVPVVPWGDGWIIPNGEARPRVRTPEVWRLSQP